MISPVKTAEWAQVRAHAQRIAPLHLRQMFADDPQRDRRFWVSACGFDLDYAKQRVDTAVMQALFALADAAQLGAWRQRLYEGQWVNNTEQRAALHMALRAPREDAQFASVCAEVHTVVDAMRVFSAQVRDGSLRGADGRAFTDVINLGIGGSDLGPRMVCAALADDQDGPRVHFVANVDGAELHPLLQRLEPATTLIIVTSKSFTTQETIANARRARQWLVQALGESAVADHFVAISTHHAEVDAFGITRARTFGFWEWVGGRYSLWSAVGLSIMLALGADRFDALRAGAYAMDQHFLTAPHAQNLPVLLGLLGVWNRNFLRCDSQILAPYAQRLEMLVPWLQQLEMESNGKGVDRSGHPVAYDTTPALWGGIGCNGQHAYFQMLHQGPAIHAIDFVLPIAARHPYAEMHQMLKANCLAQSAALMRGKTADEVRAELLASGMDEADIRKALPHRVFAGNRPSNTLLMPRLDAWHLGALLALYEHRCFVQSVLWNINPFDQWGVELGKQLAKQLLRHDHLAEMDASTRALAARVGLWGSGSD